MLSLPLGPSRADLQASEQLGLGLGVRVRVRVRVRPGLVTVLSLGRACRPVSSSIAERLGSPPRARLYERRAISSARSRGSTRMSVRASLAWSGLG